MGIEARLPFLVRPQIAQDQIDVRVAGRLPRKLPAQRVMVIGADIFKARDGVLDEAVILVTDESKSSLPAVGEGPGNGSFEDLLIEASKGCGPVTFELLGRPA